MTAVPEAYGLVERLTTIIGRVCRVGPGVLSLGATLGLGYAFLRSYFRGKRLVKTPVESE